MKKILTIFLLIMIIICFYQIANMYALYKTTLEGEYNTKLGVWSIKVNNKDISSGEQNLTLTLSEDDFTITSSNYVEDNKIAPGTEMYVDLIIDPSNTDVSVMCDIEVKIDEDVGANIEVSKAENYFQKADGTDQTENTDFTFEGTKYSGIIPLSIINQGYVNRVRIYFTWTNDEENNLTDSELGSEKDKTISIPIDIVIKQYMGENDIDEQI